MSEPITINLIQAHQVYPNLIDRAAIASVFKQSPERLLPLINLLHVKYQILISKDDARDMTEEDTNLMIDLEQLLLGMGCYPEVDREG